MLRSHPAGVRGLKLDRPCIASIYPMSHPAGVRGLKYVSHSAFVHSNSVAPRRGAWIEIVYTSTIHPLTPSHPAGVRGLKLMPPSRSPYRDRSHPAGVRGLKYVQTYMKLEKNPSHPAGVRGLKFLWLGQGK